MRNITECQQRLISLGYPVGPDGADGKFGNNSLDAFNRFRASKGLGPVVNTSMADLNRLLFPEEQPANVPKKTSPLLNWLIGFGLKQLASNLKDTNMPLLLSSKTVITGIIMVVVGGASLIAPVIGLAGIPGLDALSPGEAWTSITTGFGLIFLRGSVAKVGQ